MSKQTAANDIYSNMTFSTRKEVIAAIVSDVGVSAGYASTLYNKAKKSAVVTAATAPVVAVSKPAATKSTNGISGFDKANLKTIRRDLSAALELVEKKHGVKFDQGNIRFSASNFRMTLNCDVAGDPNVDAEKIRWDDNCFRHGLKPEDYGSTFKDHTGTEFTVCGINPRAKRGGNPVIAVNARGTKYIWKASIVRS